jgi:lipoic acid synthetase
VITSVDRDDLRDGGAGHFVACIQRVRELSPETRIEILTPDFRGRMDRALEILKAGPAGRHEPQPRNRPAPVQGSASRFGLRIFAEPAASASRTCIRNTPTKSGIMVGLGETDEEVLQVMRDMRAHNVDMLTIGQYLMPSGDHLPVRRYVHPDTSSRCTRKKPTRWASCMRPSARWCVRATMRINRRTAWLVK